MFCEILSFSQDTSNEFYLRGDYFQIINKNPDLEGGYYAIKSSNLENFLERIITKFENIGYPFVEAKLENIKSNKADLVVSRGELYTIDSLAIYGNTKLTEKQLFQLIGMKKGEVYNQSKLDRIKNKLSSIPYLKTTQEHAVVFHKKTADIYLYLEKVNSNLIDGLIGFSKNEEEIEINGHLNITLQNLLNKGENIQMNWSAQQDKFQKMNSNLYFPNLIHSKIGSTASLDIYRKNNNFTNTKSEFSINTILNEKSTIGVLFQNKNSISENNLLNNSKINTLGMELKIVQTNWTVNSKSYFGNRETQNKRYGYLNLNLNTRNQFLFSNSTSFNIQTNTHLIFSKQLQENELLYFGGSNSLKGFSEDEFTSSKYSLISTEISYKLDENTSSNIFFQQALYRENNTTKQIKSVGTGVNLKSKSGIIYLQYAIGISENKSFNLQNGMIHIGIKNTF